MRPSCIFIACLVLVAFCSVDGSDFSQNPDKCCFSFSSIRIPLAQVQSYHTTHFQCQRSGIIFVTEQKEICADPTERWVQRLKNLVDARLLKDAEPSP